METQSWRKELRKNYSNDFKLRMVELASRPGACVAQIARENGINDNVIFKWLRLWQEEGRISRRLPATVESSPSPMMLPVEVIPNPTPTGETNTDSPVSALEDALRQKDSQLSLVAETESFLRSALARAEEKIENEAREIEHLRAQIEKLRRMLFGTHSEKLRRQVEDAEALLKQQEQQSDRYNGRDNDQQVPRQLRQSRHRRPLSEHLPREINRLEP